MIKLYGLQVGVRRWTQVPQGLVNDCGDIYVDDEDDLPPWVIPFVCANGYLEMDDDFWRLAKEETGDHGWPYVYVEWDTIKLFLNEAEAKAFATENQRKERWDEWQIVPLSCGGKLEKILENLFVWRKND